MSDTVYKVWLNIERINEEEDLYEDASEVQSNGEEYTDFDEAMDVFNAASTVGKGCLVLPPDLVKDLEELLTYDSEDEEEDFIEHVEDNCKPEDEDWDVDALAAQSQDHIYGAIVRLRRAIKELKGE